ncbi:hypothetical protein [Paractinoplanes ferrugineus]|uniref:CdiA C-terminal domain-containing protein n=1 Tax=Paractinoplanes ferrugineus TaxID=113564 RepID=UPI001EF27BE9|nr:hypothetical protein [Actinoplanes ferrugineus]
MESETAILLADRGYRVHLNPSKSEVAEARLATGDSGNPLKNPDYLIEGRVFDCYAPTEPAKNVRGIHWEVKNKVVTKRQTQRVVVNLADWAGDMVALRKQFADWPIEGLKELKAITPAGDLVQIDLPSSPTESVRRGD